MHDNALLHTANAGPGCFLKKKTNRACRFDSVCVFVCVCARVNSCIRLKDLIPNSAPNKMVKHRTHWRGMHIIFQRTCTTGR